MNTTLSELYGDVTNPAGLGSIAALYKEGKKKIKNLTRHDVERFLESSRTYTLHKLTRKHFPRRKILAAKPRVILTCDLGDFSALQKHNNGVKYILFCLDVFSRYLQVATLTSKSRQSSLIALKSILDTEKFKGVSRLFTDLGTEFYNQDVKNYLKSKRIILYSNYSRETKASLAERLIKTMKIKIFKFLTEKNTLRYIDVLQSIVNTYNNSPHRGLGDGQTPAQVHDMRAVNDLRTQFRRMYLKQSLAGKPATSKLAVGTVVRLQLSSRTQFKFHKGYKISNTEELFKIRQIDSSSSPTVYYLSDLAGEEVKGAFYREELIKAALPEYYQVDVLRSKIVKGRRKYLVHWRGYADTFDSWVNATDLIKK